MSKEFISAKEAAVLLNCSERHIHNLVDRARLTVFAVAIVKQFIDEALATATTMQQQILKLFQSMQMKFQLVEHLICNQRVGGSSPFAGSINT